MSFVFYTLSSTLDENQKKLTNECKIKKFSSPPSQVHTPVCSFQLFKGPPFSFPFAASTTILSFFLLLLFNKSTYFPSSTGCSTCRSFMAYHTLSENGNVKFSENVDSRQIRCNSKSHFEILIYVLRKIFNFVQPSGQNLIILYYNKIFGAPSFSYRYSNFLLFTVIKYY